MHISSSCVHIRQLLIFPVNRNMSIDECCKYILIVFINVFRQCNQTVHLISKYLIYFSSTALATAVASHICISLLYLLLLLYSYFILTGFSSMYFYHYCFNTGITNNSLLLYIVQR